LRYYTEQLRRLLFVDDIIKAVLTSEVKGAVRTLAGIEGEGKETKILLEIPKAGISSHKLHKVLHALHSKETTVEEGKAFAYTYTTTRDMDKFAELMSNAFKLFSEKSGSAEESVDVLLSDTWKTFMHTNALNPMVIFV
jgi:hypothetical protein